MQRSVGYIVLFATIVCVVCGLAVASAAVGLAERQKANKLLDKRKNVLMAAGLASPDESLSAEEINSRFAAIKPVVINLETDAVDDGSVDPNEYDPRTAKNKPDLSYDAPPNDSAISRIATRTIVYHVMEGSEVTGVVLPVEGYGLWTTLYGYLALDADTRTIRGLAFYEHGETPGLGGEVDNPNWKALWPGRIAFDDAWTPEIEVIKGRAGSVAEAPHKVDGLSGATITSNGVTKLLQFWLGDEGFGPYLEKFRAEHAS